VPNEFLDRCERLAVDPGPLIYASRKAAKVGCTALQKEGLKTGDLTVSGYHTLW
jgi:hypothetical protein